MKKISLLILICNFIVGLNAQIKKNTFVAETSFNFSQKNEHADAFGLKEGNLNILPTDKRETNLLASVKLGHTITKNITVGISMKYAYSKKTAIYKNIDSQISDTSVITNIIKLRNISPGFFVKTYVKFIDRFYFVPSINFAFNNRRKEEESRKEKILLGALWIGEGFVYRTNLANFSLNLSLTFLYRVQKKLAIQVKLARLHYNFKTFQLTKTDSRPRDLNFDINPINWEYGVIFFLNDVKSKR